jgi:HSP20 family protein
MLLGGSCDPSLSLWQSRPAKSVIFAATGLAELSEWPKQVGTRAAFRANVAGASCAPRPDSSTIRQLAVCQPSIGGDDAMLTTRSLNSTLDRMMSLNRVLDQAFNGSWNGDATNRVWVPALDVVEKRDAYIVIAELPGVNQSQVALSFEQNVLTIRGEKSSGFDPSKDGELRVYAAERVTGTFERAIRLPEFVDSEKISAELREGILTVTIPKATAAQPRQIEIKQVSPTPELTA